MAKSKTKTKTKKKGGKQKGGNYGLTNIQDMRKTLQDEKMLSVFAALGDPDLPVRIRKGVISKMSAEEMKAVREVIYNFLENNIPINVNELNRLREYKQSLRNMVKRFKLDKHKRILKQSGGFLPLLIPLLTGVIGSAVGGAVKGAIMRKK